MRRANEGDALGASTGAVVARFREGRSRPAKPKELDAVADRIAQLTEEETNGAGQRRSRRKRHGTKGEGKF